MVLQIGICLDLHNIVLKSSGSTFCICNWLYLFQCMIVFIYIKLYVQPLKRAVCIFSISRSWHTYSDSGESGLWFKNKNKKNSKLTVTGVTRIYLVLAWGLCAPQPIACMWSECLYLGNVCISIICKSVWSVIYSQFNKFPQTFWGKWFCNCNPIAKIHVGKERRGNIWHF